MRKLIISALVGLTCVAAYAVSVQGVSIAAGSGVLTGTWVNTVAPKGTKELKSMFIQGGRIMTNETLAVSISNAGHSYNVDDSGAVTSQYATIDFNVPVAVGYAETFTVTRTTASTSTTVNAIMIIE